MKKIYSSLFFLLVSGFVYAQDPQLLANDWHLMSVTLNGELFTPPMNNPEVNDIRLTFLADGETGSMTTYSCNTGWGDISYVGNSGLDFSVIAWTLTTCSNPDSFMTDSVYVGFYTNATPGNTYTYIIEEIAGLCWCPPYNRLTVTAPNGNTAVFSSYFLDVDTFGKSTFSISPNPADDYLDVAMASAQSGQLALYDITGRLCRTQAISATGRVDVSGLTAGIYLLNITTKEGIASQKVVIR